mmetsp:Transcript_83267/g.214490  ORF Transcript_83267/g.214490 Transcript_83267/m.214490 type:complete len:304 (-) Transcript_83267:621-1532(-)
MHPCSMEGTIGGSKGDTSSRRWWRRAADRQGLLGRRVAAARQGCRTALPAEAALHLGILDALLMRRPSHDATLVLLVAHLVHADGDHDRGKRRRRQRKRRRAAPATVLAAPLLLDGGPFHLPVGEAGGAVEGHLRHRLRRRRRLAGFAVVLTAPCLFQVGPADVPVVKASNAVVGPRRDRRCQSRGRRQHLAHLDQLLPLRAGAAPTERHRVGGVPSQAALHLLLLDADRVQVSPGMHGAYAIVAWPLGGQRRSAARARGLAAPGLLVHGPAALRCRQAGVAVVGVIRAALSYVLAAPGLLRH